jgi:hypothetical protein
MLITGTAVYASAKLLAAAVSTVIDLQLSERHKIAHSSRGDTLVFAVGSISSVMTLTAALRK